MRKAYKILVIYLVGLLIFSFIFSCFKIYNSVIVNIEGINIPVNPMIIVTILGGIIALKYTVSPKALKIFLILYSCSWALRFLLIYAGSQLGEVFIFNKSYRFDRIISFYYENAFRSGTPLPFLIYWFINHLFFNPVIQEHNKELTN